MDMLTDFENMDVLLGSKNVNPNERELANTINGSTSHNDTETFSQQKGNPSPKDVIIDFSGENTIPRQDRLLESMEIFSNEINMLLS